MILIGTCLEDEESRSSREGPDRTRQLTANPGWQTNRPNTA